MPRMISKIDHEFNGAALKAGQPFDSDDCYVATLIAVGHAELATDQADPGEYQTRVMTAREPRSIAKRRTS